jgi:kumamolisin
MEPQRLSLLVLPLSLIGLSIGASAAQADTVQAVVNLKERTSMEALARAVTDPSSPRYQEFYTPQEIREIAGPTDADYTNVLNQLKSGGALILHESPTHLSISIRADRALLQSLRSRSSIVSSISGLQASHPRHPHMKIVTHANPDNKGLSPDVVRKAYNIDAIYKAGYTGKDQNIAIATYDGFYIDDVKAYYAQNNLSPGPSIDQVTFNGTTTFNAGSAAETQTDAEFSGMIAPGASIHVFASADNSDTGELAMFTAIMDDNRSKIVNYSWGTCETTVVTAHKQDMDKVLARAVAQGINVMIASGDSGSDCLQDGSTVADFPSVHPYVVAVGGTTLTPDATTGLASEVAWNGSGGGMSNWYKAPSYQKNLGAAITHRAYPDVAFNADPNSGQPTWVHYDPNNPDTPPPAAAYVVIGGTSIASPQWSGFLALVGEARASTKTLGFMNPIIYAAGASNQGDYFNDVISGSNGSFTAAVGWDEVTGWGSMKGSDLFALLRSH